MWVPTPAFSGLKTPVIGLTIPIPAQFPPGLTAVKTTEGSVSQNGPTSVIVASTKASTVMLVVPEETQAPLIFV